MPARDRDGVEGTRCTFNSQCGIGYSCINDSAGENCNRWCATTADCLAPRGQCVDQLDDGAGQPIAGAVICSSNCDPTVAANPLCPSGTACDIFTSTFGGQSIGVVECRIAGTAGQGAACSATVACAAGFACVTVGSANKCAHICAPPANTGCPGGTTCGSFSTPFKVAGTEYGVCL